MKTARLGPFAAAILCLAAVGCSPAPARWNGNWKLNVSSSRNNGSSLGLEIAPNGTYTLNDAYETFTFACDGKEYPDPSRARSTIACNGPKADELNLTYSENGKPRKGAFWSLSEHEQTLTILSFPFQRGSEPAAMKTYHRVWGTSGFAGEWLDAEYFSTVAQAMTLAVNGRTLHMVWPGYPETLDLPLNGSERRFHGGSPDLTVAARSWRSDQIGFVRRWKGRIIMRESMTVSADGRTLTETFWVPGRREDTSHFTWEKQ
jgi:hypothetical protein